MSQSTSLSASPGQGAIALAARACSALALVLPLAVAGLWAFASWDLLALVRLVPPDIIHTFTSEPHAWQRAAGAAIGLIPTLILSHGLLRARRALSAFGAGDFFGEAAVSNLRGYAAATFWSSLSGIFSVPAVSAATTFANGPGHRELSLDLSGVQFLGLLGAMIVWVLASAMAKASLIAHENEQFI